MPAHTERRDLLHIRFHLFQAVQGGVPLPDRLLEDTALHARLLKRAERETKQSYCPCQYLGLQTAAGANALEVPSARRRHDQRLGVSRIPCLEISGSGREGFYQQKLLLSLPWYCPEPIKSIMIDGKETLEWTFRCDPPTEDQIGARLPPEVLKVTTVSEGRFSFEEYCKRLEASYTDAELGVVCLCCSGVANSSGKCDSCRYATGWHRCHANGRTHGNDVLKWRAGTLHSGHLDVQRCLFNLHRRHLAF